MLYVIKQISSSSFHNKVYEGTSMVILPQTDPITKYPKINLTKEERDDFEKELGLPEKNLSPTSSYWLNEQNGVRLTNGIAILDDQFPVHQIQLKWLAVNDLVATQKDQVATGNKKFLLLPEDQEQKESQSHYDLKRKAYIKSESLTIKDKQDYLISLGIKLGKSSDAHIDSRFFEEMEKNSKQFLNKISSETFKYEVLINKLVNYGILKTKYNSYYFNEIILANSKAELIDFLLSKQNGETFEVLVKAKNEYEKKLVNE